EVVHLFGDRRDALALGIDDDRGDQAAWDRDRDGDIGTAVFQQLVAGETDVAFGHFDQRHGERLDHQIVDAELDPAALEPGVELGPELQKRVEVDVDGQID